MTLQTKFLCYNQQNPILYEISCWCNYSYNIIKTISISVHNAQKYQVTNINANNNYKMLKQVKTGGKLQNMNMNKRGFKQESERSPKRVGEARRGTSTSRLDQAMRFSEPLPGRLPEPRHLGRALGSNEVTEPDF